MTRVIVVGGGLAGLSAAHTILERGGRVVLLEKNGFMGGNSTKATSGINGAGTAAQRKLNIPDTPEIFYEDTAKSARDLAIPPLMKVLTYESGSAVEWIQDKFGVDMSLLARLGGHSQPRTHRGKEKFPGMTMTYALMERLEEDAEKYPDQVEIIKKANVTKLIKDGEKVIGVEYTSPDGSVHTEHGPVIIATGGYAADFSSTSLLKKYRPDIYDLPTTNGDHCTGDGIKMSTAIGANSIHMEKVQVHPTGLVDPKDPDAKIKFLAAEALRGVGGVLLDANGKRFADELGHRDYVTGLMWKNKGPFRLVLNSKAGKEIEWHCKHYQGRGLMKFYNNGAELAREMGISVSTLADTFTKYNDGAAKKNDPFGKRFFHNLPFDANDSFWVAIVCPVLHFTMGGIQIDEKSQVLGQNGIISGLYAAGEVAGGVHGANRLGGSSLLGCVVYGRVAGASAAAYLLNELSNSNAARRIAGIAGHLGGITISANGITMNISANGTSDFAPQAQLPPPTASKSAPAKKEIAAPPSQEYTLADVAKHNTENDCWVVVNGQVLDVTNFLPDHPGGKKSIMLFAGKDASEEFNMLHKPEVIAKYAPDTIRGTLKK
ncbi:hypothetical protein HK098_004758 [Nowakowskiella sp. JEL0407]|nr:hypothetical protein HK098_004758 [Nowakowskiella sp. JEL0407]